MIHNFSSIHLSNTDVELLSKGLSFTPTPKIQTPTAYFNLLHQFDYYANSIRSQYVSHSMSKDLKITDMPLQTDSNTPQIFRKMKFLKNKSIPPHPSDTCNNTNIENYIYSKKIILNKKLKKLFIPQNKHNLTRQQQTTLKKLCGSRHTITIKPADKNLGIGALNTHDYLQQCIEHLSNENVYRLTQQFPQEDIKRIITNTLVSFKQSITYLNKKLYNYLQPIKSHRIPQFYGIPKIHKKFIKLPPIRPIVSHSNSLLSHTAQFIDHVLQPLAQSYPDYLKNSNSLIKTLNNFIVPEDIILVTIDVTSLYPSIPQTECLQIIYDEMNNNRDLIIINPNLIIQLLQININYNYFEFMNINFQQIQGTAMGATFSPTIANIFMSIFLKRFLQTQTNRPTLLRRYIDDIFLIWPKQNNFRQFIGALNSFHPSLQFTYNQSENSIDFLDITIYKGDNHNNRSILDIKTFQKPQNLYQYLHYTSHHPKSTHKGIIIGECKRYIRTNTSIENYQSQLKLFEQRLLKRGYPTSFINKHLYTLQYSKRQQLLDTKQDILKVKTRPIFKCLPPPQFSQLKKIILCDFHLIQKYVKRPLIIGLSYPTLKKALVRAHHNPNNEQFVDALLKISNESTQDIHITSGQPPSLKNDNIKIKKCNHSRCITCSHLNIAPYFTSHANKTSYTIRHSFTCNSKNLIYLITCSKCKKQYVGMTTKPLRERINHHRTSIFNNINRYINNHFNFPDYGIHNLTVQPIDTITNPTFEKLTKLERFWIRTLNTYRPQGLNNTN